MSDAKPRRVPRQAHGAEPSAPSGVFPGDPAAMIEPQIEAPREPADAVAAAVAAVTAEALRAPAAEPGPPDGAAPEPGDSWQAIAQAQAVLAGRAADFAAEAAGIAEAGLSAGSDAAIALLRARSLVEALGIGTELMQRGAEVMIEGSARLSAIGIGALTEAARPLRPPSFGSRS